MTDLCRLEIKQSRTQYVTNRLNAQIFREQEANSIADNKFRKYEVQTVSLLIFVIAVIETQHLGTESCVPKPSPRSYSVLSDTFVRCKHSVRPLICDLRSERPRALKISPTSDH